MAAAALSGAGTRGDEAEFVGIAVFNFIITHEHRLARFLERSGLGPDTLRSTAESSRCLFDVLDYAVTDEAMLSALEISTHLTRDAIEAAHTSLALQREQEEAAVQREL